MVSETQPLLTNNGTVIEALKKKQRSKPSRGVGLFMIVCGINLALLTAGVIFGFGALKVPFYQSGAYGWLCDGVEECEEQRLAIDFMFSVASVIINLCALPIGIFLDKAGPRFTSLLGSFLVALGLLLLAFSNETFPAYVYGYSSLALGGLHIYLSIIDLINIFPRYVGTINGLLTGAFDSSSMIPVFWQMIFDSGVTLKTIFFGYLIVPTLNAIFAIVFLRETQIPLIEEKSEEEKELREESQSLDQDDSSNQARVQYYDLFHLDLKWQLLSWEFLLIATFISVSMLRLNFFIETMDSQMTGLGFTGDDAKNLNTAFYYILPIGGIASVPIVGFILDFGGIVVTFATLEFLFLFFSILNLISIAWIQYLSFGVFVLMRTCLYASVTDFTGRMFGFTNFGVIYGSIMTLSACVSLVQHPLSSLVATHFGGDFKVINLCLFGAQCFGIALPLFVYFKDKKLEKVHEAHHHIPESRGRVHSVTAFGSGVVYTT